MKNDKIVNAFNAIQAGEEVKNRVFKKAMQTQIKKRPLLNTAVLFAAAAAICLMVFGGTLLSPQSKNVFSLKAYAMEQLSDGSIELREVNLHSDTYHWSFYNDGSVCYVNTTLKCEGENIRFVEFYADNGFFAKQYLKIENGKIIQEESVSASYAKGSGENDYTLLRYGTDFERIGNSFTLDPNSVTDDYLLFVGMEVSGERDNPSQVNIRAVATFTDGKTQEETIILNVENAVTAMGTGVMTPDEIERVRAESIRHAELVHRIPLEQCEIVPGSEIILTYGDTFEYPVTGNSGKLFLTGTAYWPITEESMDPANDWSLKRDGYPGVYDDNGVMRFGNLYDISSKDEYDGSNGQIAVIVDNGDGTFTGMVYKVPGRMILEYMK